MENIKKTFVFDQNILVQDVDNKLWIMGDNKYFRTGFVAPGNSIYLPIYTRITLDEGEEVKKFYARKSLVAIYTTKGRLYIAGKPDKRNEALEPRIFSSPMRRPSDAFIHDESSDDSNSGEVEIDNENDDSDSEYYNNDDDGDIIDIDSDDVVSSEGSGDDYSDDDDYSGDEDDFNFHDERHRIQTENSLSLLVRTGSQFLANIGRIGQDGDSIVQIELQTQDSMVFDNAEYFAEIADPRNNEGKQPDGMVLLAENIENILFVSETIFFSTDNKLYLYNKNLNPYDVIIRKKFGFSATVVSTNGYQYYQLLFPFGWDKMVFTEWFIYLSSKDYHHVVSAYSWHRITDEDTILWIYFKFPELIDEKNIYFLSSEGSLYVRGNTSIHKYCHRIQELRKFFEQDAGSHVFFPASNNGEEISLFCLKEDGLYLDYGVLVKKIGYHELLEYVIDCNFYNRSQFILINHELFEQYHVYQNQLYFNVNGLTFYKLLDFGLLYMDKSNTLYLCCNEILDESIYGTAEITKINTKNDVYYIYMFNNVPDPITSITTTNNIVLVQSGSKYYYLTIETTRFTVNKFTEIFIKNEMDETQLVLKHYIVRTRKKYDFTTILHVSADSDKFAKFFNIIEMLPRNTDFEIKFRKETDIVSYGDGPKRQFMEDAIIEFANKYFVQHNVFSEFDISKMNFSDDDLVCIGAMLHSVICHSNEHLPIRLPLTLVAAILKKKPNVAELEYFAKIESPEPFEKLRSYKNDPEGIKETGYETYDDCLKSFCKYYHDEKTNDKIFRISKKIAKGFRNYFEVKNLGIMNLPTLDYFLSGDYRIDRDLLTKNLKVRNNSTEPEIEYTDIIIDVIKNLPEDKLSILLRNWSGTSVVKKSSLYLVSIEKPGHRNEGRPDVYFGTCNISLSINEKLVKDENNHDMLYEILTTPCTTMVDPQ